MKFNYNVCNNCIWSKYFQWKQFFLSTVRCHDFLIPNSLLIVEERYLLRFYSNLLCYFNAGVFVFRLQFSVFFSRKCLLLMHSTYLKAIFDVGLSMSFPLILLFAASINSTYDLWLIIIVILMNFNWFL